MQAALKQFFAFLWQKMIRLLRPRNSGSERHQEDAMGINSERDVTANLQIGPTDQGMVRIYVESNGTEIPMDFDVEEAREIAEEILAAAAQAAAINS